MKQTQQKRILEALIRAGDQGLNSYFITYDMHIKQGPTRVKELRLQGHDITSETLKDRSVQYRLIKDSRHEREGLDYIYEFTDNTAHKVYLNGNVNVPADPKVRYSKLWEDHKV